jgi:hypothetical protein
MMTTMTITKRIEAKTLQEATINVLANAKSNE